MRTHNVAAIKRRQLLNRNDNQDGFAVRLKLLVMCQHERFKVQGNVTRLLDDETESKVIGYRLDVEVWCDECKKPFTFEGLPKGWHPDKPTTDLTEVEARMPIKPLGA